MGKCRINIKFLVKLKKSAPKIFQILTEAHGDETLSYEHEFEWHKRFSGGGDNVEDVEHAGCPSGRGTGKNGEFLEGISKTFVPELLPERAASNAKV
ncbi:hypothetical protein TNCV_1224651 [Trichonephila clavipes]|nr:hypothetical protein TNCV_1224651 [Trichonephila clavipes]